MAQIFINASMMNGSPQQIKKVLLTDINFTSLFALVFYRGVERTRIHQENRRGYDQLQIYMLASQINM